MIVWIFIETFQYRKRKKKNKNKEMKQDWKIRVFFAWWLKKLTWTHYASLSNLECVFICSVVPDSSWSHGLYSLPGSSVYEIFQARIVEWVAISTPDLPGPGSKLKSPASTGEFFTTERPAWEALFLSLCALSVFHNKSHSRIIEMLLLANVRS